MSLFLVIFHPSPCFSHEPGRITDLTGSYFATYELLKQKLSPVAPIVPGTGEKAAAPPLSIGAIMLAGGTAGVAMWSVAIPPDVSTSEQDCSHCLVSSNTRV